MATWRVCERDGSNHCAGRGDAAAAGAAVEDSVRGAKLSGARGGTGQARCRPEPLLFFKPNSALLAPGGVVKRPKISQRVDYEGELCVVIGKKCHLLADGEDVRPYILGYTCLNDVTMRDIQKKEDQWARAKGFDTFVSGGSGGGGRA